jgi:hypothetical protein
MDQSFEVGQALAEQIRGKDLVGALVLSDGLLINGSELVRGLNSLLPPNLPASALLFPLNSIIRQ